MQSAGFTETRSHPPIQNLAKTPKLRYQAELPHFVYSMCVPCMSSSAPFAKAQEKYEKCKFFFLKASGG